jgi:hypothetical protein
VLLYSAVAARWSDPVVVVASGPSLTQGVAEAIARAHAAGTHRVIAVNDAYRLLPAADVVYASDVPWWNLHEGCPGFAGEKWSSHGVPPPAEAREWHNDKRPCATRWGLRLCYGAMRAGFSLNPELIHYGQNSGFQAVNLAGHFTAWSQPILLAGFDMRVVGGKRHFFGDHPQGMTKTETFQPFLDAFIEAARLLPKQVAIVNCTPGSALRCFPLKDLDDALSDTARSRSPRRLAAAD